MLKQIAAAFGRTFVTKPDLNDLSGDIRYSLTRGESMADWWNRAHSRDHKVWLTGSSGQEVWSMLEVDSLAQPGATVLNIGVGLGRCTRDLADRGCVVHALDISQVALDRVADVARGWLDPAAPPTDTFDLAISHLVAQHMRNADLEAQLARIIPSLKRDGVYAIQFATPLGRPLSPDADDPTSARGGSCQRLPETVEAIVARHGGRVLRSWRCAEYPAHMAAWQAMHIGR
jgi:cyclopropane fatty-acyl-phospholipid synthase-like methyltransferase